ncbi:small ubiquitin-related modifier [Acrasis kona]|uniref:Small ubiquitin-related modifier n=1 Tax=Acrasis kona TaxID=1008807 RepID=A0AAW2Z9F3_9EUKA
MPPKDTSLGYYVRSVSDAINISIHKEGEAPHSYNFGADTPLGVLFSMYCLTKQLNPCDIKFSFCGNIDPCLTARQMSMKDNCIITAHCGNLINIVIRCPSGDAHYIVSQTQPIQRLFDLFRQKYNQNVKFQFNGRTVCESETPQMIGLTDGSVVRAISTSIGPESIILIELKLEDRSMSCRIRRNTLSKKLFDTFCIKMGVQKSHSKFMQGNNEIPDHLTLYEADIKDNDIIQVQHIKIL